jgi:hypothetical protein
MDIMLTPCGTYTKSIPRVALSSSHPHPVQRCRDVLIGPSTRHASYHRKSFFTGSTAMLTRLWAAQS